MNGNLRRAREMGEGFDPAGHGLLPVHLRMFEGLIFVSTAENPPDIDRGIAALEPLVKPYGLAKLKIAKTAQYPVPANWKLAIENYMECYHCGPAHLEYSRSHSLKDPDSVTEDLKAQMQRRAADAGLATEDLSLNTDDGMGFYYRRYPLFEGYKTGSKSGEPVAPLLGTLTSFDGGTTDLQVGILNNFLLYSDHVIAYRFLPAGLQETNIKVVWFVRDDAIEGEDYDLSDLTWLWHITSLDDERIIRVNQEGVNSYHFKPGPLSKMEWGIRAFYDSYLGRPRKTNGGF
jgi:phenylpropionate dioxygenase-like ring-hydroxylating dioxygenase large terminal subunit